MPVRKKNDPKYFSNFMLPLFSPSFFKLFFFYTVCREVVNAFEMKQLKDRVSVAMSACDSANKLKVRILQTIITSLVLVSSCKQIKVK